MSEQKTIAEQVFHIDELILPIRNQRVILDSSLAKLYQVETKRVVESVKRHKSRFPSDFVFQLSVEEFTDLKSRGSAQKKHGGRRSLPYAFTEQGVAMASSVLNSERAVLVNIEIMRAFVRIRQLVISRENLNKRLDQIEAELGNHSAYIRQIFSTIKSMIAEPNVGRKIGFGRNNP
jgi:hypothetical protein